MDVGEALAALGLAPGASAGDVRRAYLALVRTHHPDVAGRAATGRAAQLNQAYAVLRSAAAGSVDGTVGAAPSTPPPPSPGPTAARGTSAAAPPPPPGRSSSARAERRAYEEAVEAELAAGDTILVRAPATETFAAVLEAAGRVGDISYVDRQLLIIEAVVRFEGGPSCSVLITLQGRVDGTEAFCTMESLEAAPTPPLRPVVDALVEALTTPA